MNNAQIEARELTHAFAKARCSQGNPNASTRAEYTSKMIGFFADHGITEEHIQSAIKDWALWDENWMTAHRMQYRHVYEHGKIHGVIVPKYMEAAYRIGSLPIGAEFQYPTAHGIQTAKVVDMYNLPQSENPLLVYFSGYMPAAIHAMETIRWYSKTYHQLMPCASIGFSGNKGLFSSVFNRKDGIVIETEDTANRNIMSLQYPATYVNKLQIKCSNTNTVENFKAAYELAQKTGKKQVTLYLVTGQIAYTRRLVAEWLWEARKNEYKDIKVDLVFVQAKVKEFHTYEGQFYHELNLGYLAASLGPLMKDTITFDGYTSSQSPERYALENYAIDENLWQDAEIKYLIRHFNNMGWPNYDEMLYQSQHLKAVKSLLVADFKARLSFTPEGYDEGILTDVENYQNFVGSCNAKNEEELLSWCINSTNKQFF